MKHFLLFTILLVGSMSFAQGQGDLTIYSNTGDKFYVILNGIRQNDKPETNVKVTGLENPWYSCKIISASNNFEIEKNVPIKSDTLMTYRIIGKKGKYKLKFYTETAMGTSTAQTGQSVIAYHATDAPVVNQTVTTNTGNTNTGTTTQVNTNTGTGNVNVNESSTTTTTTVVTSSTTNDLGNGSGTNVTNGTGETINMNINIGETGVNANVNINENGGTNMSTSTNMNTTGNGTTTYYEETTTTTTTTSNGNITQGNIYQDDDMVVTMEPVDNNCFTSDTETDQLVKQLEGESFSDDQLRIANLAAKNKCFNATQIKKIAGVFDHSDDKLSFAKTAYDRCSDKSNYYQVMEVFTFSSDKEELEKYINSRK